MERGTPVLRARFQPFLALPLYPPATPRTTLSYRRRPPTPPPLRRLLDELEFRANATRLGAIIRDDAATDRAVAELEAVGLEDRSPEAHLTSTALAS
jgi:hypothetical protein